MKILVVSYLPSGQVSRTKKLLDAFLESVENKNSLEHLDLLEDVPDFFDKNNLEAYKQRNYKGQTLSPELQKSIEKIDRMVAQFVAADIVVMAFPMYNFSVPGLVKTYFDSIILKGETFDMGEKGFIGLMKDKKALILMSSGGVYKGENNPYDYATGLAKLTFEFMGFSPVELIMAQGMDMQTVDNKEVIVQAQEKVREIASEWGV